MSDPIKELRELYEAGTRGPWEETGGALRDPVCEFAPRDRRRTYAFYIHGNNGKNGTTDQYADAALIVAMHRHLPALLAVVEAARDGVHLRKKYRAACINADPVEADSIGADLDEANRALESALSALTPTERTSDA